MSVVAHFFMSAGGSEIHERLAHFFIDIYINLVVPTNSYLAYEYWMPQWRLPLGLDVIITGADNTGKCKMRLLDLLKQQGEAL